MNDTTIGPDQTDQGILTHEVSEALETAGGTGKEVANVTMQPIWCPSVQ